MRILVVGAGAMGCLFAARLKRANHEVSLLEVLSDRVEEINRKGIRVEGLGGKFKTMVPAFSELPSIQPDLILICVKAYDTREAAKNIRKWLTSKPAILSLQNGLGNVEILLEVFGGEKVLGGVTAEGATLLGSGRVRHAGQGETIIQSGPFSDNIVSAFTDAGFRSRAEPEVRSFIWGKLIVNAGINALTAITRLKNGRLPELEGTRSVMEEAVREAFSVSSAMGISLPFGDPVEKVKQVCRDTAANIASMLQDILKHRRTEVAFINGAIAREGKRLGIPTPVNSTLASLVSVIEDTYLERVN